MPERVRPPAVADMTGLSLRKVQEVAAAGQLPGAAKLGGIWTFDPAAVRGWIRQKEAETVRRAQAAASVGVSAVRYGGGWRIAPDETINARFQELIHGKKKPSAKRSKQ